MEAKNILRDRVSELPQTILHQILSHLPLDDVARASSLSETWNHVCSSYPMIDIDYTPAFFRDLLSEGNIHKAALIEMVDKSICRFQKYANGLNMDKFRLSTNLAGGDISHVVDRWIWFAVNSNVKELKLHLGSYKNYQISRTDRDLCYELPSTIFRSESITILKLAHCRFDKYGSLSLPHLKTLSLKSIENLDETVLLNIFTECPLIEDLRIQFCSSLKSVNISSLELKFVDLVWSAQLEVSIQAPCLEYFCLIGHTTKEIKLASCQTLKKLLLIYVQILTDDILEDIVLWFPLLETLVLDCCNSLKNVVASGCSIRNLVLTHCVDLVEVKVNTPKLLTFVYAGKLVALSSTNIMSLSDANISLDLYNSGEHWYIKLRSFLESFNHCKVLQLKCSCYEVSSTIP